MLALFSGSPYVHPTFPSPDQEDGESDLDLQPHLTNTCLQTDALGAPSPPAKLVKEFRELEGLDMLSLSRSGNYVAEGKVDAAWLERTFKRVGEVVGESVKAGAECGSFGLQFLPNAFEVGLTCFKCEAG